MEAITDMAASTQHTDTIENAMSQPKMNTSTSPETVVVEVGTGVDKEQLTLPTYLLIHHSSFFRSALEGDWAERRDGKVTLSEEDSKLFTVFAYWVQLGEINIQQIMHDDAFKNRNDRVALLLRCWIMGDMLRAVAFKNDIMDDLVECFLEHEDVPTLAMLEYIYDNTPARSHLRHLAVDLYVWHFKGEVLWVTDLSTFPQDFVFDCFKWYVDTSLKCDLHGELIHGGLDRCDVSGIASYIEDFRAGYHEGREAEAAAPNEH